MRGASEELVGGGRCVGLDCGAILRLIESLGVDRGGGLVG